MSGTDAVLWSDPSMWLDYVDLPTGWIRPDAVIRSGSTRSGMPAGLQLICGVGPYELEVLVQDLERDGRLEFAGQVTKTGCVMEPVRDLAIELVCAVRRPPVASTRTDVYGEFDLNSGRDAAYAIRLGQGDDAPCVAVWEEVR